MPLITPYVGLSADRLTTLINSDNDNSITPGIDFSYGVPISGSFVGADGITRNSRITLTPIPGSQYSEAQDVTFHRLGIDVLGNLPEGSLDSVPIPQAPFFIHDVLGAINQALGLNLLPAEVENTQYLEDQDTYTLTLLGDVSLAWVDSTYDFAAHVVTPGIPLRTVIVITDLDGFDYVQPPVQPV